MNGSCPVDPVDKESIDEPAHRSAHPQRTEKDGPHEPRKHVSEAGKGKYADDENRYFEDERTEPEQEEWPQVQRSALFGVNLVIFVGNEHLVSIGLGAFNTLSS